MAIIKCSSEDQLHRQLLRQIQECADRSRAQPLFCVGLSGGSLASVLAAVLPKVSTDWSKWRFLFCDERLVPFADKESTFGAYRTQLLDSFGAISRQQFVTIDETLSGEEAARDYERKVRALFGAVEWPRFDLLLLGMGPDGHTCSLFPNHALLKESNLWIAFIDDSPKPPPARITLTLPVLNNAKCCLFYATGASKADVLREVLLEKKKSLPVSLVKPNNGKLVWLLDDDSARLLPRQMLEEI